MTNESLKKKFNIVKFMFGNKCTRCFSTENLEFAHIKPTDLNGQRRGRNKRIIDILNHFDCYNLLCKDCHSWYDYNNVALS